MEKGHGFTRTDAFNRNEVLPLLGELPETLNLSHSRVIDKLDSCNWFPKLRTTYPRLLNNERHATFACPWCD